MWVVMGRPAILTSLPLSVYGSGSRQPSFLAAGAALSLGFARYLTLWPSPVFKVLDLSILP